MNYRATRLSGGQKQRVAVARALMNEPALILADEPTGNLDRETGLHVLELLQKINRDRGVTVLMVTHDEKAAKFAQRILLIEKGQLA
jgi:ABC-type lipoprotein export system ATPase subunit